MIRSSIYLREATLPELLEEIGRRFEEARPVPEWAGVTLYAVASFYGLHPDQVRSARRDSTMVKARHLTLALLAQLHPTRTRAEICEILGLEHHMYAYAIKKTEEWVGRFPDFKGEVKAILGIIQETRRLRPHAHGHCRTSPQGTSGDLTTRLQSPTNGSPPAKIAS